MKDYIDFNKLQKLSDGDDSPLYQKIIKLSEETGELAQAFLGYDNSKNSSKSANGDVVDVIEETCDVINVAMDIINDITKDNPELENVTRKMFITKLIKWEMKQQTRNSK